MQKVVRSELKGMKLGELQYFSNFQLPETFGHFGRIHHLYGVFGRLTAHHHSPRVHGVGQGECPTLKHQEWPKHQEKKTENYLLLVSFCISVPRILLADFLKKTRNPNPTNTFKNIWLKTPLPNSQPHKTLPKWLVLVIWHFLGIFGRTCMGNWELFKGYLES